jgi:hypothetical protein
MLAWGHALARGDMLAWGQVDKGKRQDSKGAAWGDRMIDWGASRKGRDGVATWGFRADASPTRPYPRQSPAT